MNRRRRGEGARHAAWAVLVVVEPQCLLTGVALRHGMRFVAANSREVSSFDIDLDAAVQAAENASRGMAFSRRRRVGMRRGHGVLHFTNDRCEETAIA